MTYQTLTCPNCQGRGCPTCQNTGKVRVAEAEMKKLKQMVNQLSPTPSPNPRLSPATFEEPSSFNQSKNHTNLAGIIAFSILSLLAGGAAASWYFLRTLKPFFFGLISVFTFISAKLALNQPFFQLQEPDDFLSAIKNR